MKILNLTPFLCPRKGNLGILLSLMANLVTFCMSFGNYMENVVRSATVIKKLTSYEMTHNPTYTGLTIWLVTYKTLMKISQRNSSYFARK